MLMSLTIVRYPAYAIPFAFISMALFRIPLYFMKGITFSKLLGCGKNGTFDLQPDLRQWGLLAVWETEADFDRFRQHSFIQKWWNTFAHEQWSILCLPTETHGKWSGREPFIKNTLHKNYTGPVAVLTRASIRFSKLGSFWRNVPQVAQGVALAKGFITSVGIGEVPLLRQATFSIWESPEDVRQFAYRQSVHADVIRKTRTGEWYAEELFARFIPLKTYGTLQGKQPFSLQNGTV